MLGYLVAVVGALVATLAIGGRSLPLFMVGILLVGFGNSANLLSRYAAADLYPVARRASAIGLVVWGATFGAVLGPNLVGWAGEVSEGIGLPALAGAYLLPIVFVGGAALLSFVTLRPDPYELADSSDSTRPPRLAVKLARVDPAASACPGRDHRPALPARPSWS